MTRKKSLKILFVEDTSSDAELAIRELRKGGLEFEHIRVETRDEFIKALNDFNPDIIISDYVMPSYDGMRALLDAKEINPQIPFILFTGSVNEETAVRCIQAGADDYIIKEHLTRLPYAVKEVLEKSLKEKEKNAAELLLRENEEKLQSIFRAAPVGIGLSVGRVFMEVNDTFCTMTGYTRKELIGKSTEMIYPTKEEFERVGIDKYGQIAEKGIGSVETRFKCKDGKIINVFLSSTPLDKSDLTKGVTFTTLDITERVKAEDAFQKSQHLFQALAQVSPVGIFRTDPDGNTTYVNPKWSELSGLSSKKALGAGWLKAVHPDDRKKLSGEWLKNFKTDKESSAEYRFLKSDGSTVWVMGNAVPELIDNEVIGYIGTITDITERKKAEEVLRESQQIIEGIINAIPARVFWKDENLVYLGCNTVFAHDAGFVSPQDIIGKNDYQMGWHGQAELYRNDDKQVIESGHSKIFIEESRTTPNGNVITLLTSKIPLLGPKGEIKGILGTYIDITDRKQAEEKLERSEEKYRRIFENVQDVFYELSIRGNILETSPSIELLSKGQYKRDDLIGKSMYDFYPDPTERRTFLLALQEHGFVSDFEINLKNRDGSNVPCSVSAKIIFNVRGRPEKIIGSMHDITDRKNATEALKFAKEKAEANDRLKTTFLNNISHEVRTPLNGILGFAEIISQADLSEEEKNVSYTMLHESTDRLLNTITNYMDISLINSGTMSINCIDFSPDDILMELYSNLRIKCVARNLELILETPDRNNKIRIFSDPEIGRKILAHLLNNAIKFTEKGVIKFGYAIRKNEVEFFVKDTGIGIGEESLENVFKHFIKEDRGPHVLSEGSGLGLSISKGLAGLLGGKITVESEINKGSTFFFTLPAEKKSVDITLNQDVIIQNGSRKSNSILVAEDDNVNFYYIKSLIKKNTSADIIYASNGKEAVEKFKQNPDVGLILMDIKMPVMDGLEATRQIKAIKQNVPIIAITAYVMVGDEARILKAGCDEYLIKPINKELFLDKLARYVIMK